MIDCYDFIECGYLGTYVARKASAADDGLWIWAVFDINEENFLRLLTCPHSFFVELAIKWVETNGRATI